MTLESVSASFNLVLTKVSSPLSNLFLALVLFLVGIILARLVKLVIQVALKTLQLDVLSKAIKFNGILEKAEIKKAPSELAAELVYWLLIFLVVFGLAAYLKLPVEPALDRIISYTGTIFIAALVLSLGVFLSAFVGSIVFLVIGNLGLGGAKPISKIIQYTTIVFAFLLALEQIGIGPAVLSPSIGVIIGAVGLAAAIAFGLGCKDIMADFVSNLIRGK